MTLHLYVDFPTQTTVWALRQVPKQSPICRRVNSTNIFM